MTAKRIPSPRKRGAKWIVQVTVNGRRRAATFGSKAEAEAWRDRMLGLRRDMTLAELLDVCCRRVWAGRPSEQVAVHNARVVVEALGPERFVSTVTTADVEALKESLLESGRSPATVNRYLAALSRMLTEAAVLGALAAKPVVRRLTESRGRLRYLTEDEEAALLAEAKRQGRLDLHDAVVVLIDTGLRTGELWKVRAADIDHKRRLLMVWKTKNGDFRAVPLTARAYEVLKRRFETVGDRPFPYKNDWLRHQWDAVRGALGKDGDREFVPHILRHTRASRLAMAGADAFLIQQWMGHKSLSVTRRYTKLAPEYLLEWRDKLDAMGGDGETVDAVASKATGR